ncbi:MAG: hypothetical protein U9N60_08930 [Thermodesulfobacteriota bacterium]|nr:hypothetical protein [Thermodesulfobacteriota bacterium]
MFGSAPQGHFLRGASQGGEQADQLYLCMLGSLIAFLWSAAEYLHLFLQQFSNNIKFNYTYFDRMIIRGYKYLRISARISRLTIKRILMMI